MGSGQATKAHHKSNNNRSRCFLQRLRSMEDKSMCCKSSKDKIRLVHHGGKIKIQSRPNKSKVEQTMDLLHLHHMEDFCFIEEL